MTQLRTSLPLALLALLGPAAALAAPTAADYLRGTTPAINALNRAGQEADERFFTVKGVPANLMFLLDTSGSMQSLVMPPDDVDQDGTGCANPVYNDLQDAGGFSMLKSYPPPDVGIGAPGDNGFPELFREDSYYEDEAWDEDSATAQTLTSACNYGALDVRTAACTTCMSTRGYYLDPNGGRDIFSGKFLNFYPPRFVTARTTLKKVIWNTEGVRMGLFVFNAPVGGKKIADLAPDCTQILNEADTAWQSSREALIQRLNDTANCGKANTLNSVCFQGATPLAEALLDVGQYFTTDSSVFESWFGTGWYDSAVANPGYTTKDRPFCYGCQVSSVVVITDGAPNGDNCMPDCIKAQNVTCAGCDVVDGNCNGTCPGRCQNNGTCSKSGSAGCCVNGQNYMDDLAKWLNENDLQTKSPSNASWSAAGRQKLATYTIGFALEHPLLVSAAAVGGGRYATANNADSLESALVAVINDVNTRATTFGVSSISTLQTNSGINAVVPRFIPSTDGEAWKGFLYRFNVVNELINGCMPTDTSVAAHPLDLNGDHDCNDLLYTDRDDDVVEEDALTGLFLKRGSTRRAIPIWEAGRELTYPDPAYVDEADEAQDHSTPGRRNIWTVIDSTGDGRLDASDEMVEFVDTDANATKLMPYLGFGMDVTNEPFCVSAYTTLGVTSAPLNAWGLECAKVLIRHYRGYRATSADPAVRDQTRPWLLADIFHSTPVEVLPPVPIGMVCSDVFDRQCLPTLYRQGQDEARSKTARDAYMAFREGTYCGGSGPCEERRQLVLVGSNGGFLHAFDYGGRVPSSERDPFTGMYPYTAGTGEERWAFIPPDLLGVLRHTVGRHAYLMDGTAMVREVWVDADALDQGDGVKAAGEYRTIAVMGERSGGVHYFGLDITQDVVSQGAKPKPSFLWMWPQPNDPLATRVGDSWNQYYPKPPPIGPVLLDASSRGYPGFTHSYLVPTGGATGPVAWDKRTAQVQERWVVGLSGGYDRALLRGRGFGLVDAWTGQTLWDAFHEPGASDLKGQLEYPWVASMALLDAGAGEEVIERAADGYFDSFTVGDMGGNLWMGRMYVPGTVENGKVTNWTFARAFQTERDDGTRMTDRRPFTVMTESAMQYNGFMRTLVGTGERAALLDTNAGTCSLDSPYECIAMGCKVSMTLSSKNAPSGEWFTSSVWQGGAAVGHARTELTGCTDLGCFLPREESCFTECTDTTCSLAAVGCPSCAGRNACLTAARSACPAATCTDASRDQALTLSMRVSECPTADTTASSTTVLD
ncbi:MAG: hypothetical protein L0Y64_22335, partial [Myxococcaceae bacterium]|nr:hypothetical protein [Myxococcaceae bacterium]